jgi:hypothetical protein
MLLFRSEEHVQRWYGEPPGESMSVRQQWDLARTWYADRTSADWRRRTPAEAEEVFASIGLTGGFWRLTA